VKSADAIMLLSKRHYNGHIKDFFDLVIDLLVRARGLIENAKIPSRKII